MRLVLLIWLVLAMALEAQAQWFGFGHDTRIRVVDERGVPVAGAKLYYYQHSRREGDVYSDAEGRVRIWTERGIQLTIHATADGHYLSRRLVPYPENCSQGKCQIGTLDEVTLRMNRRANPIPMLAQSKSRALPVPKQPVGFDMEKGDWVAPHGAGKIADFTFFQRCTVSKVHRFSAATEREANDMAFRALGIGLQRIATIRIVGGQRQSPLPQVGGYTPGEMEISDGYEIYAYAVDDRTCRGEIRFPNPGDGIQFVRYRDEHGFIEGVSDLKSDHEAPENGYQPVFSLHSKDRSHWGEGQKVIYFRIRTQLGDGGRVVRAWYGKSYTTQAFVLWSELALDYYLNPTGTRNVEFDPKRNLMPPELSGDFDQRP